MNALNLKTVLFTFALLLVLMMLAPSAHAMTHQSAADLAAAQEEVLAELKQLNQNFNITVHERVEKANELGTDDDGSNLLRAEIDTLPGAEVSEPWILASPETALKAVEQQEDSSTGS